MTSQPLSYRGYRFPPEIISHAVWLYHRFGLSFGDVEDLLAERGVTVTYEAIRQWCLTFGLDYARRLRRRRGQMGDTWYLDELFVKIQERLQYLWRAVDEDGDVIDILVQSRGGLAPADTTTRAPDAPVQVRRARAAVSLGPGPRTQSLPRGPSPTPSSSPPVAQNALVPRLV